MACACCWFSSEQDFVCQGLLFLSWTTFHGGFVEIKWVEQQVRKETCDHFTECKAK